MSRHGWIAAAALAGWTLAAPAIAQAQAPACEPGKMAEKYPSLAGRTLKIGADPQTPPYVMRDAADFEQVTGFDADLARAVFDCAGVRYEFFLGGWSGLLPAVSAGQIDLMWDNLYYTPARAQAADYVIYMQAGTGAMTQAGNPKQIMSLEDACGITAAFGLGTVEEASLRAKDTACQAAGKPGVTLMTYPDVAAGIRLIQSGRADLMMADLALVDSLVKDNPTQYARAFFILSGFKIGVAVANGNTDLARAIEDGLKTLQASGEVTRIYQKYTIDPALGLPAEVLTE